MVCDRETQPARQPHHGTNGLGPTAGDRAHACGWVHASDADNRRVAMHQLGLRAFAAPRSIVPQFVACSRER